MQDIPPEQLAHWSDNRGPEIIAITSVCIAIISLALLLRLYSQSLVTNPWKIWDTWLTIIASILGIAIGSCLIHIARNYGLGKHTARIIVEDPSPPDHLANIFMFGYIQITLQAACIMFIKLAILSLYARVFGILNRNRAFTWCWYILFGYSLLLGIGSVIEFILQCIPAPVFWNRVYLLFPLRKPPGPTEGYCMPHKVYTVVPCALDLVSELAIMLLPIKILWNLQMPLQKKIGLVVMFGLGIFVSLLNIVRIVYYSRITVGGDIAWDNVNAMIWTIVQMAIAILCACIPPSGPLIRRCLGQAKERTKYGSSLRLGSSSREAPTNASIRPIGAASFQSHELLTYSKSSDTTRLNSDRESVVDSRW